MGLIGSFIDLSQGILLVDSPRCKERLQIKLLLDVSDSAVEDIELHGQRYLMLCTLSMDVYTLIRLLQESK